MAVMAVEPHLAPMTGSAREFYDDLAPDYHLLFADWSDSIARQGRARDRVIRAELGEGEREVLDCACGIGTRAIGLAGHGHRVTGSDLSPASARRASSEAAARGHRVPSVAADICHLPFSRAAFDVVVCAHNAIAQLLSLTEPAKALVEMKRVLRPNGLLIPTTRSDFARERHPTSGPVQVSPTPDGPVIIFQLWDWDPDGRHYDLQHIQLKPDDDTYTVRPEPLP